MDKDCNEDPDEVIFVTPHAQPIFVPDSDIDDASWLYKLFVHAHVLDMPSSECMAKAIKG